MKQMKAKTSAYRYPSIIILLQIFLLLSGKVAFGTNTSFKVTTSKKQILIGDTFSLLFHYQIPSGYSFVKPVISDSFNGFNVIARKEIKKKYNTVTAFTDTFILSSYIPGQNTIPAFSVIFVRLNNHDTITLRSEEIVIKVFLVRTDLSKPFRNIKSNMPLPVPRIVIITGIAIFILICLILTLIIILRKKGRFLRIFKFQPHHKAMDVALNKINSIAGNTSPSITNTKQAYSEISVILKEYLEARLKSSFAEYTTRQLIQQLQNAGIKQDAINILKEILTLCDIAKFANSSFDESQFRQLISDSILFIERIENQNIKEDSQ